MDPKLAAMNTRQREEAMNVPAHLRATGFIVVRSQIGGLVPLPIRLNARGNPIAAIPGENPIGDYGPAAQYTVYETEELAWQAITGPQAQCEHEWRMLSHEEAECRKCGAVRVMPDE